MKYLKATVFDKETQKELHRLLDRPIEKIIDDFVKTVNEIEQTKAMEFHGELKHPRLWTESEKESIKITDEIIDYETAKDNLEIMINIALNQFC